MVIPSVRSLDSESFNLLRRINKDRKQWYRTENQASIERSGKPLFKSSFHDYGHSAPISLGGHKPIPLSGVPLSNEGESLARHYEDTILQGLPNSIPKSQMTPEIENVLANRQTPQARNAYDMLYKLGQYSVEKKNQLQSGTYPPSKTMLNKFSFRTYTYMVNFGTLADDIDVGRPVAPNLVLPTHGTRQELEPLDIDLLTSPIGTPLKYKTVPTQHLDVVGNRYQQGKLRGLIPQFKELRETSKNILAQMNEHNISASVGEDVTIQPVAQHIIAPLLDNINHGNALNDERDLVKNRITTLARKYSRTPFNIKARGGLFSYVATINV